MNPWALAADEIICAAPTAAEIDAETEYLELLVEVALEETPAAQRLPRRRVLQAVYRADQSMGWPTSDSEVNPGQDVALMIQEIIRRAGENLRLEVERAEGL